MSALPKLHDLASMNASVLIVDDEALLLRSLTRSLSALGLRVHCAQDAANAMLVLDLQEVDAVLCDINLPVTSGAAFARLIRQERPELPVIFMTGNPQLDSALEAFELGIFEYLPKPLDFARLSSTLRRAVALHRLAKLQQEAVAVIEEEGPHGLQFSSMNESLERALDQIWIAFQPIVDVPRKKVVGFEALLRSRDPVLNSPVAIFDCAQKIGRVADVGRKVRKLAAEGFALAEPGSWLFLNVHPEELTDATLCDPDHALSHVASRVILEITERSSLSRVPGLQATMASLRRLGFRLAVDDLGAGYAGLSSFAVLEPELAKLDMSLVRSIDTSPVRQRLVASMVTLCNDLGNRMVAEGVETAEERDTLSRLGCALMQGYFFAKPAPPFPVVSF